ncbi:MAG: hypothetical protein AB1758_09175 [Candidatus Eremiobacterota bacterium]
MRRRGLSLMELVVALGLLALTFPMLLNLLPASQLARRKAENLQSATSLALEWLEDARVNPPAGPGLDRDLTVRLNGTRYQARREVVEVSPEAFDVVVTLEGPGEPVRLATRIARGP